MNLAEHLTTNNLWNPYDFANPVNDRELFAGRSPELKDIRYYLRQAHLAPRPINLVLTGPRSSGKTSLLNRIELEAMDFDFCVARVDLNEADVDPLQLFYKVYDAIIFAAVRQGAFAGTGGQVYTSYRDTIDGCIPNTPESTELLFPRHYSSARTNSRPLSEPTLKIDLATISRELGKPCVVLFDECDVLSKSRVELEMLRNVFMNTPGYMLVFSGTPNLFPVMEDVFSPIVRQFKKIPVEKFEDIEDTEQCISRPLAQLGINPEDAFSPSRIRLVGEVHRLSGGRPYEIQLLCHYMFKRVENGGARDMAITLDVLDDVKKEFEKQESGTGRRSIAALPLLSKQDFSLLQALTEFEGTIEELSLRSRLFSATSYSDDQLVVALDRFVKLGLLRISPSGVVGFDGDQFDEIYARYYAAANESKLFIWKGDFWGDLRNAFNHALAEVPDVQPIYQPQSSSQDSKRRVQDALEALIGPEQNHVTTLPDMAASLYVDVLGSHASGKLTVAEVTFKALGGSFSQWLILESDDEDSFLSIPQLVDLSGRAERNGVDFRAEIFSYMLGDREEMVAKIKQISLPNQLEDLGDAHYELAFGSYNDGNIEQALADFRHAMDFFPSPTNGMAVAHTSLLCGDYDHAITAACTARTLASEKDLEEGLTEYAFATYDCAVGLIGLGIRDAALCMLDECEVLLEQIGEELDGFLALPSDDCGDQFSLKCDSSAQRMDQAVAIWRSLLEETSHP